MIRNVKSHSDMVSLWCEFWCYLWGHLFFHGKHIWQCSHWYGFSLVWGLMWFFCKIVSAMLTLIWFLLGVGSYVILLSNLFQNTRIEMVSLWYAFLYLDDRIELVRHDRSPSYAYILCSRTLKVLKWQILNVTAKKLWLGGRKKKTLHSFSSFA